MNNNQPTVAFYTLGCKLNYAESSEIGRQFARKGYSVVDPSGPADVFVINSCTVTSHAEKKCRQYISKINNRYPGAIIAIVGCYSQLRKEELSALNGVKIVLGTTNRNEVVQQVENFLHHGNTREPYICAPERFQDFEPSFSSGGRTRSFLKVQDGCDYGCSYCTIPLARGFSRNPSISDLVSQATEIARLGIPEIVLTGVNVGDFGRTTGESFLSLLNTLDEVEGVMRYRISSIEPNLLTDDIIRFVAGSRRFAPHFHIPLQSGNNQILALMRRRYIRETFAEKVLKIKSVMPHACVGADVIVGFPGETGAEFGDTCQFIQALPISYLHVFSYSERDNTPAARYTGQVPKGERMRRSRILQAMADELKSKFYISQTGTKAYFIPETWSKDGIVTGFTENYIKTKIKTPSPMEEKMIKVQLIGIDSNGDMQAEILN